MAQPQPTPARIHVHAEWDRRIVPAEGGPAILITQITATGEAVPQAERAPVDTVFVIDRSGSMSGEPLRKALEAATLALDFVEERDRIALVSFDHNVRVWHDLAPATAVQKQLTRHILRGIIPGGSTNLSGGWDAGCNLLAADWTQARHRVRRIVLLTDGHANVGITDAASMARKTGRSARWASPRPRSASARVSTSRC